MRRGFTLIEVLVSLAIFALAAVGLSAAYTNVLLARQAMRRLDASDDAFTRSRAALLETASLEDARQGGEIDLPDGRKARWSTEVEPTNVSDLFSATLTVEVEGAAGGKAEAARAETSYLLRPSWSVSGDRTKLVDDARDRLRRLRPFEGTSLIDQQASGDSSSGGSGGGKKGGKGGKGGEGGGRNGGQGKGPGEGGQRPGGGPGGPGGPGGRGNGQGGPGNGQGPGPGGSGGRNGGQGGGPGGQGGQPGRGGNAAGGGGAGRGP